MAGSSKSTIEDTICNYRNKFQIDLEDEPEESYTELQQASYYDYDGEEEEGRNLQTSHRVIYNEASPDEDSNDERGTRKSKLPRDLSGLMGQANLSFARGETNDAIFMCQEVIRLAPNCPDPFISLAEHFLDENDEEKAEQLYLIAAYLEPSNPHSWVKVAEFATKRREFRLAASCYTKAIRAQPSIHYHLHRCNLYEKLGDRKRALRGYESLMNILSQDDEELGLELARGIARIYLADNKIESSIRAMENAVLKYSNQFTDEDIEQLCKSYNLTKNYLKTIDIITSLCQVEIKVQEEDWNADLIHRFINQEDPHSRPELRISLCNVNSYFTLKIRCLLLVALISLGYHDETISELTTMIESADLKKNRDSLYELANAYYNQKLYIQSKNILSKLTSQRDSQLVAIWLLYSQCLNNLDEIDEAIEGYKRVIDLNPDDFSSRLALSNLLNVRGRVEEAIEVSKQELNSTKPVDIPLLYQSCQLLVQTENWTEYKTVAKALLLSDMNYTHGPKEIMCMITSKSLRTRIDNLRTIQRELNINQVKQKYSGEKLDSKTILKVFLFYTKVLFDYLKDYDELKRICFSAYTSPSLECYESSIDFYTVMACICSNDVEFSYNHLKILITQNTDNNQVWNLFSLAMNNIYKDLRHSRFCLRLIVKSPDALPLAVINGHNALMSGSYKHALGEYMTVFREKPEEPFFAFCVSLTFLSLSCQRYVSSKYLCLFQMMAFLQTYLELRGTCQETMYNIARAFHQINMLDKAVIFYKKVLNMKDDIKPSDDKENVEIFSLRHEAAFNLALIYKNSHSYGLAYQVIRDNFTI